MTQHTHWEKPNPWGNDNRALYKPNRAKRDAALQATRTGEPSLTSECNPTNRVRREAGTQTRCRVRQPSEGLLAAGDPESFRDMEAESARRRGVRAATLIEFRETLLEYQDPANGKRDSNEYACSC